MSHFPVAFDKELCINRRMAMKLAGGVVLTASFGGKCGAVGTSHPAPLPYEEYAKHDGLGLAKLVRQKEVKPEELLEAAIARAEAVDSRLNPLAVKLYEDARKDLARGLPSGPFTGVPFLVKDLGFWIKGVRSTAGCRLCRGRIATGDDTVVKRFRKAGLVIFGRTATPEIGLLPTTESALRGVTRNPWETDRTPGGSSGGTAAAVAAGVVPMGSGGDGGGSIRMPASCCGLFGLKSTRARVPFGPELFEVLGGLEALHAITRSVRDSATLLDEIAGPELGDAYWAPPRQRPYRKEVSRSPGKLCVALTSTVLPGIPLHNECRKAVDSAAQLCEALGHRVEDVSQQFPSLFPFEELLKAFDILVAMDVSLFVKARLDELGRGLREDDLEPTTRRFVEEGEKYTALDLAHAREVIHRSSRLMANFQRKYDVILTPTLAKPPVKHGEVTLSSNDLDAHFRRIYEFMPFTPLANWTGQPAMSVPLYWTPHGLPIGVQFMGRFGDEATLFRLAGQLEQERPWKDSRPTF